MWVLRVFIDLFYLRTQLCGKEYAWVCVMTMFISRPAIQCIGFFTTLGPLGQPWLGMSAIKIHLKIHLLNLNYAENDDYQQTFSVFFTYLAKTL